MTVPLHQQACDDSLLDEVIARYLVAEETGQAPNPEEWLRQYPDLQEPLGRFFCRHHRLRRLAQPLRAVGEAARGGDSTPTAAETGGGSEPGPRFLGNYEILEEIGRGGMGVVYRARQQSPQRLVAVKMLRAGLLASAEDVQRFRNEAETIALLDHPGIVPVYEVGIAAEHLFFSMKLIEGGSLAERLPPQRPRRPQRENLIEENDRGQSVLDATVTAFPLSAFSALSAVKILLAAARAIHHAHQRGVLHRDLKPSNILLDAEGRPYVTDFGLAKRTASGDGSLTQTGLLVGTPGYMAPEQAAGGGRLITTATDVYGLGAVLYALLTGGPPFQGPSPLETLARVTTSDPRPPRLVDPRLDRDLETICLCCLSRDPTRRYSSAEALAEDLERWLEGRPIQARPVGTVERFLRWCRRNPVVTSLVATVLLLLVSVVAALAVGLVLVNQEREIAQQHQKDAEERAAALRRQLYAAEMGLAHRLWKRGDLDGVAAVLRGYEPKPGEEDLRGFEWFYLQRWTQSQVRELRIFRGHRHILYAVAFAPDGKIIASGGADQDIRLWDAATGEALAVLQGHTEDINALKFAPDGQTLASASDDGTIRLWDVTQRKEVGLLRNPTRIVESIVFTPDGKKLISGGTDAIIRIWDIATRTVEAELRGHQALGGAQGGVEALAISADGKTLASGAHDGTLRVWDLTTRREIRAHPHSAQVLAVAFSPDGSKIAAADRGGYVRLWRSEVDQHLGIPFMHDCPVRTVSFSRDGELLASGGDDGRVRLWSPSRGQFLSHFRGHQSNIWAMAFSPQGRTLATAGSDHLVRLWEPTVQGQNRPLRAAADGYWIRTAFAADQRTLVVWNQSGTLEFWDYRSGQLQERIQLKDELPILLNAVRMTLAPDGRTWAVVDAIGKVHVRDRLRQRPTRVFPPTLPPAWKRPDGTPNERHCGGLAFTPDGRWVAALYHGTDLKVWNLQTGEEQTGQVEFNTPLLIYSPGRVVATPDSKTFIVIDNRGGRVWDIERGALRETVIPIPGSINHAAVSPDGQTLALAGIDRSVHLLDLQTGEVRAHWQVHQREVTCVAFSPDGRTLASCSLDGSARLWHLASGQELFALEDSASSDRPLSGVAFSPDGKVLATSGNPVEDGSTVRLWDASALKKR